MTTQTKVNIFFIGFVALLATLVVLIVLRSPIAKWIGGMLVAWLGTVPRSKEAKSAEEIKSAPADELHTHLTDEASGSIAASPGEVKDIIETGLRNACKSADEHRGSGKDDSVGNVSGKNNS